MAAYPAYPKSESESSKVPNNMGFRIRAINSKVHVDYLETGQSYRIRIKHIVDNTAKEALLTLWNSNIGIPITITWPGDTAAMNLYLTGEPIVAPYGDHLYHVLVDGVAQ